MSKQKTYQKFIFKLHSSKILSAPRKHLSLSLAEARVNEEIISLGDREVLRFIDELNGLNITEIEENIRQIRQSIRQIRKNPSRRVIREKSRSYMLNSTAYNLNLITLRSSWIKTQISKSSIRDFSLTEYHIKG